jgi:hypothetical protein
MIINFEGITINFTLVVRIKLMIIWLLTSSVKLYFEFSQIKNYFTKDIYINLQFYNIYLFNQKKISKL